MNLNPSRLWSNWKYVSGQPLLLKWRKPGGDWVDAMGVVNGPAPTISRPVTSEDAFDLDISGIDGDLLIQNSAVVTASIDGVLVTSNNVWWSGSFTDKSIPLPSNTPSCPVIVLNPGRGRVLTLKPHKNAVGRTLRVDKLSPPPRPEPLPYQGESADPDIWEIPFTSEAALFAFMQAHGVANPTPYTPGNRQSYAWKPEFLVDAEYGFPFFRFRGITTERRLIAWFLSMPAREEAWVRYLVRIGLDMTAGMTEQGSKMPGLAHYTPDEYLFHCRTWHGAPDPANPHLFRWSDYFHEPWTGLAEAQDTGAHLHAGRWECGELGIRLNTPGMANGLEVMELNGHVVKRDDAKIWRHDHNPTAMLNSVNVDFYQGGQGPTPRSEVTVDLAFVGVSTQRMGVPRCFFGPPPPPPLTLVDVTVTGGVPPYTITVQDAAGTVVEDTLP